MNDSIRKHRFFIFAQTIRRPAAAIGMVIICTASMNAFAETWLNRLGSQVAGFARRIPSAAWRAASSPYVWVPASGALAVYGSGLDDAISDWASSTNPVFGSQDNASDMSDVFRDAAKTMLAMTTVVDGVAGAIQGNIGSPLAAAAGNYTAARCSHGLTTLSKETTGRLRPDESDTRSFPSGHTSIAAVHAMLSSLNIERTSMPVGHKRALQASFAALTVGTGWARVEGKHHYPTDVLVGAALGNFTALFFNELLAPEIQKSGLPVNFSANSDGAQVNLTLRF